MDRVDASSVTERAACCAKEVREIVEGLPAQTFGGDLSRDFIVEGCNRVENAEPSTCKIEFPDNFVPDSRLPRVIVGTLGDTGVGKSKFLSALLGKGVLPTSSSKRGTSFPTIIVHHPLPTIEAAVSFMTEEAFTKHVEIAIDLVKTDDDGNYLVEASLLKDPSYSLLQEALGLYRDDFAKEGTTVKTILDKRPEVRDLLGKTDIVKADSDKKFLKETTRRYTRRIGHNEFKKWPLVDLMVIKCDSDLLSEGVILVDLPGSSDVSASVTRTTEAFKDKLQFTLGAAGVERSQDDADLSAYINAEIARQQRMQSNDTSTDESQTSPQPLAPRQPPVIASALAAIVTKCDSTTNVKIDELERDIEIAALLRQNKRYLNLRKHQKALESRIRALAGEDDEDSDVDELASDDEVIDPPADDSQTRKRSQPSSPPDVSAAKRRRTSTEGNTESEIKFEASGAHDDDSDLMDVDQDADSDKLEKQLSACKQEREIIAAGVRSQVICRTIRKQYKDKATGSLTGTLAPFPVFATSAEDFTKTQKKSGKLDLTAEFERTGIPAVQTFVRNLGAREQYAAALSLIQPFRSQVTSVLDLLSTSESPAVEVVTQQKREMMERWVSRGSHESSSVQINVTAPRSKIATKGIQSQLKESLNTILRTELKEVRCKLVALEAACNRPLAELAADHVPRITQKIVQPGKKRYPATWRALLSHYGVHGKENWNRDLAAPLIKSMTPKRKELYEQWNKSAGIALRNKLVHAGVQVLQEIILSSTTYDAALSKSVTEHVNRAVALVIADVHKLQQIIITEVLDGDERDSRPNSLIKAVEKQLADVYFRAYDKFKGKNSQALQKEFLEEAIDEKAETMFEVIVTQFIEARRATVDRVEAKLLEALDRIAKEAELAISPAWTVAGHDIDQIAERARASKAMATIHGRLTEMETVLKDAMARAKNVPTCYPPPTIADDE